MVCLKPDSPHRSQKSTIILFASTAAVHKDCVRGNNQRNAKMRENYRPGAPAMTWRVLQAGGGVARVRGSGLCRGRGFVVAASKAGDERDLLRAGGTRTGPGL